MNTDNHTADWKQNPVIISLLVIFFFPVGLYLVWKYPGWESKTKWIITGVVGFFVLVIGASKDKEKDTSPANVSVAAPQQAQATPVETTSAPSKPDSGYELGKEFTLGDYKYKIISVSKEWRIGKELFGEFIGETPSPGASFVVVTYTIENCTNESQVVKADDFKLVDGQKRTFGTSSRVSTALMMHTEDKDFLVSELQPGIPRRMQQGFELPDKALESEVTLIVPKKGLWSTGDARLTVRVR